VRIFETPLTFRLEFVSGDVNSWIDWFQFSSAAATESQSWGAIKSLFR
jgi:hypothetical protein